MALFDPARPQTLAAMLTNPQVRSALVIAHPAHELRVHAWMQRQKPACYILTTGSRSGSDMQRWQASAETIAAAGATLVATWGRVNDARLYAELVAGERASWVKRTLQLAADFVRRDTTLIVTDSWQYYNVAHDLTHVMARCAAELAARELGRPVAVLDYPVTSDLVTPLAPRGAVVLTNTLSADAYLAKREAVRSMPDVASEVAEILASDGQSALQTEQFRLPPALAKICAAPSFTPYYETFGKRRVAAGIYPDVVRWPHVACVVDAIVALVEAGETRSRPMVATG